MFEWKYIVFENKTGNEIPIIFPPLIKHEDMARRFETWKPISAGFIRIRPDNGVPYAFGKSISLNLSSRPEDDDFIMRSLKGD